VLSRGAASPTVLRVEASMTKRGLGKREAVSVWASKSGLAKLLLPTLLVGAGLGALWSLNQDEAQSSVEARPGRSLPLPVEDVAPVEPPAPTQQQAAAAGAPAWAPRASVQLQKPSFHAHRRHAASHKPPTHAAPTPPQPVPEAEPPPEPPAARAPASHT
jgi:hypothetical protein